MDLFPSLPITKSPKLLWMERHNIKTAQQNEDEDGNTWFAVFCDPDEDPYDAAMSAGGQRTGRGDTEDAALTALALAAGIKLWNEEGA
jgi:hypothetical protein